VHDLKTLAGSGDAKESAALAAARTFANSPERQLAANPAKSLAVARVCWCLPRFLPNYAAFIRKTFGARAGGPRLGRPSRMTIADTRLMRASLVPFVHARRRDDRRSKPRPAVWPRLAGIAAGD